MSLADVVEQPGVWLTWLAGLLCVLFAAGALLLMAGVVEIDSQPEESPVYIEEFRVAEPLAEEPGEPEAALRDQLETITAVTEPYDDIEAAVEEADGDGEESRDNFERQCTTVLKEMAFCSDEDAFLELIGEASTLRTGDEREQFMESVQDWFEPEGARRYCEVFYEEDGLGRGGGESMWREAADASGRVCREFGEVLVETEIFEALGPFWQH